MIMPGPEGDSIRATGGQVDDMTMALIDAAHDKDSETKDVISSALFELGKNKPMLVLSACHSYLKKHNKLSMDHRIVILNSIERIAKEKLDDLDARIAVDIIQLASQELTQSKEVEPEWQTAASGILVAMGTKYCDDVMGEMLQKFQPGILPHFFVVQTIGNLAAANVYGMVPHLTAVLGTMLPMLGLAKYDNMRWVFASALTKFSEAIIEYVANLDKAPDPSVSKERFAGEIFSAYDLLFNNWLQSKEAKLRLQIVEAVGQMTHIIGKEKLTEQLPKILQGILGLYRRHPEPYHITQGLCNVLDAVCEKGDTTLEPYLDNLFNILFAQTMQPVDYNNPNSMKNHNEVLRSFAIITRAFSGKLVGILLSKLEGNNEKSRIAVLTIFKHIINSAGEAMEDKKEVVVSGLKGLCQETNNKVKKVFAQVTIAMAHHGYLELEGGHLMIEFIVRQCSLPDDPPGKRPADPEFVTNQQLRGMCDNILHLVTTTIDIMEPVLWPYLLEMVVPEQYSQATGAVCRSLAHLAQKKREENAPDYDIDYDEQANIPKPPHLIARLMVLSGWPQHGRNRGMHVLQLMKGLSPVLHENIVELWDTIIPKLCEYLDGTRKFTSENADDKDKWSQKSWEDLLLKLLTKSLEVVDSEDWTAELGQAFGAQVGHYVNLSHERNFLYKCLGVILRKSTKKDLVAKHLDIIFSSIKHTDQIEREGCAISLGYTAASHLDTVLTKLDSVAKNEMVRKSSGILGFMKDKSEGDIERVKATLMLCYGYVTLYSPPSLIISRMEAVIIKTVSPYFANVKDMSVKQNLIRAVCLIGEALHPDHLGNHYNFSSRGDFITHMQTYMQMEPKSLLNNDTRALAMQACATLVKLDPQLQDAEMFSLIKSATDCVMGLPLDGLGPRKGREENYEDIMEMANLLQQTIDAMHGLLKQILVKNPTPDCLNETFKRLQEWIVSELEHERERSMITWRHILQYYTTIMDTSKRDRFLIAGPFLGVVIPRCTDPSPEIRQVAVDCVQLILRISLAYEGHPLEEKDQMVDALPTLKERLQKRNDPNSLYSIINDLSKVVAKKTTVDQLYPLIETLQAGLLDLQSHSSSGACVVLNGLMKQRGNELFEKVDELLSNLHTKLMQIQFSMTKTGTLRTLRTLAAHHLSSFLTSLLQYPVPYSSEVVEIWQILAQDAQLTTAIFEYFLDLLIKSLPYEEKADPRDKTKVIRTATPVPLAVTFAFVEIFKVEETREQVQKMYHRLFAACLVRLGSSVDIIPPKPQAEKEETKSKDKKKTVKETKISPIGIAIDAMKGFLERVGSQDLLEALDKESMWDKITDEVEFPEAITSLAKCLVSVPEDCKHTCDIVTSLTSVLSSLYENQRVTVAAFFAELINQQCAGNENLVELIMNSLLGRLVDTSHIVRMLCIRGLGNISSVSKEQVQKYSTTILSAMMAGMDDKEDPEDYITIEAMSGLSRIMCEIDESHIRAILINVALKIRPCFEREKPAVRAQAFILFGNLSRFGDGPSLTPFLEQIHSNIISLLLHLNDVDLEVRKSCKYALRHLGPLMGSQAINEKFQKHLLEEFNLFYGEFMNDLSKLVIQDFPDKVNFYVMGCVAFFKSSWSEIRSNAAMFVGFLLGNLPKERQTDITKEHVCNALILLLKDPSPLVRAKAAEAMSLLYDY